jgi:tetratricopeptide (TPR) repeat protein
MYRIISCVAVAVLASITIPPAAADDASVCSKAEGDDSIAACTRFMARHPRDDGAYNARGLAYGRRGEYDRAIADYNVAISINPRNAFAYNNRGFAYGGKGDFDRAIADYGVAIGLDPKLELGYANRGEAYSSKGEYDHAIADYGLAISLNPKDANAYRNRGNAYYYKKEYDRAIADFDQAVALNPKDAGAYNTRGIAYEEKGDEDRAMADYTLALTVNPSLPQAYNSRGNMYDRKGDYDRAIADYSLAISLAPKVAVIYVNRGRAYNHKGEYDRAVADLSMAISLDVKLALPYGYRGFAYARKGDFDRAMADVNRAIALDPKDANGYSNRAAINALRGDAEHAIADADEAIRLDPKNGFAYNWRANALLYKGSYDRAVGDYDQAVKLDPASAEARQGRERAVAALAARQTPAKPVNQATQQPEQATAVVEVSPPAKPPVWTPGQPARRALVIGIDSYPNLAAAAQLERAVADADAVGDQLASLGFQVTRLTSSRQNTLDGLLSGFEDFRRTVGRNDMVVLFYAGHGMGLPDGTYLVPADVREASLEVETTARRAAINENEFTDGLQRAGAGIVVAVIDACRNDLFSRGAKRAIGYERGLRPIETEGIFKLYSASEGQTALDHLPGSDASRNSVFTRVFLKAISTPGLNLNALGAAVRDETYRLARSADHRQIPAVYDKLIGSTQVYFAGEGAERRAQ